MFEKTLPRIDSLIAASVIAAAVGTMAPGAAAQAERNYVVQLASVKSEVRAKDEWKRLQNLHTELLGDLELMLQRVDLGDQGIFFRMQTGPFPNRTTAVDMCRQFKAVQMDCLVRER